VSKKYVKLNPGTDVTFKKRFAGTTKKWLTQTKELSLCSATRTLDGPACRKELRVVQKYNTVSTANI
jgi:hypothetical protein